MQSKGATWNDSGGGEKGEGYFSLTPSLKSGATIEHKAIQGRTLHACHPVVKDTVGGVVIDHMSYASLKVSQPRGCGGDGTKGVGG